MIIKNVKLENVRSYKTANIDFKKGINILWGDIGSGKTTVLMVIEFAIFGLGKDEGKLLLRKGTKKGKIEVILEDNEKTIIIERELIKKGNSIRQGKCKLTINNETELLSPSEIDSKLLNLLNYPKFKQQKNLVYRYLTYTPQENLKKIIEEKAETRLEIIRKVFGIEKYKSAQEAIIIYIKKLKEKITIEKEKIKDIESIKKELKKDLERLKRNKEELLKIKDKEKKLLYIKKRTDETLKKIESKKERLLQEENNISKTVTQVIIYQEQIIKEEKELNKIKTEINELTKNKGLKSLEEEFLKIKKKYEKHKEILNKEENINQKKVTLEKKKSELESIIKFIKKRIKEQEELREKSKNIKKELEKLKEKYKELRSKIPNEELVKKRKEELISKKAIIIEEIAQKKNKINEICNIKRCPTCLQKIDKEHKEKIRRKLEKEINEKNIKLKKIEIEIEKILDEIKITENLEKELEIVKTIRIKKELDLSKIKEDIKDLNENKEKIIKKNKELNELNKKLNEIKKTELKIDNKVIEEYNKIKETIQIVKIKKKEIKKKEENILEKIKFIEENQGLTKKLEEIKNKKKKIKKIEEEIEKNQKKINLKQLEIENKKGEITSNCKNLENNINKNKEILEQKNKLIKKIIKNEKLLNWLTNDIINLLKKVESFLMLKYYEEFNEKFEKIFKELIEDNNIDVYLENTSFSPIVEQNGYETSFINLSGGEKSSLALAYRLGLGEAIKNNLNRKLKLNCLILDEPTDGFSNEQINRLSKLISRLNFDQIIIVSHDEKLLIISGNIIKLEKNNHISTAIKNENP